MVAVPSIFRVLAAAALIVSTTPLAIVPKTSSVPVPLAVIVPVPLMLPVTLSVPRPLREVPAAQREATGVVDGAARDGEAARRRTDGGGARASDVERVGADRESRGALPLTVTELRFGVLAMLSVSVAKPRLMMTSSPASGTWPSDQLPGVFQVVPRCQVFVASTPA